jgi:uncharacterized membrane protein YoaK (UPF0700 family)
MLEVFKLLIGIGVLILGVFIGKILARYTQEELDSGQIYFKILTIIGLIGGVVGLLVGNDVFLFSMFFIALVTVQSVKKKNKRKNKKNSKKVVKKKTKSKKK